MAEFYTCAACGGVTQCIREVDDVPAGLAAHERHPSRPGGWLEVRSPCIQQSAVHVLASSRPVQPEREPPVTSLKRKRSFPPEVIQWQHINTPEVVHESVVLRATSEIP